VTLARSSFKSEYRFRIHGVQMKPFKLIIAAAALALSASNAYATFTITSGSQSFGENVLVNACTGNITGPASLVQGCLNSSHTTLLDVSTPSASLTASGGQAVFSAASTMQDFTVRFDSPNLGFSTLVFNIDGVNKTNSNLTFSINAVTAGGVVESPQSFSGVLDGNGQNFYFASSVDGEVATSLSVHSSLNNIVDISQIRITSASIPIAGGELPGPNVPEPATLSLLASAFLAYGALRRRQQQRLSA
jgi:hypothetical protein